MRQRVTRALLVVLGATLLVGVPLVVHAQAREMSPATPNQMMTRADAQSGAPSWWSDMVTWCESAWQGGAEQSGAAAGTAPMRGTWGGMMMPMHMQMTGFMSRHGQYGHMGTTSPMNRSGVMPGHSQVDQGAGQSR